MPQWAIVLTLVFSGLSLLGSGLGALVHVRLSAKNSGRLEEKVDGLAAEMGRQRTAVGECQLATHCEKQMQEMSNRVLSAHKRMDRQDGLLDRHEGQLRDLDIAVAALKVRG